MSEDWRARRQTFDSVAEEYDQIRPGYPEQLFLDVIEDEYIRLLGTYSDHLRLPNDERALLFERITTLINERYGASITKGYATLLYLGTVEG